MMELIVVIFREIQESRLLLRWMWRQPSGDKEEFGIPEEIRQCAIRNNKRTANW